MGSLMAGWDSKVLLDPNSVKYTRNRSLTRGEIESYWKSKKRTEEEHLKAISTSTVSDIGIQDGNESGEVKFQRSSSLPLTNTKEGFMNMDTEISLETLIQQNGWWKRSTWAFLNETPVLEKAANSYTPQFHVANLATASPHTGINAQ